MINRRTQPAWGRVALELTGGRGVDHVLELAGGDISESMAGIAQGGRVSRLYLWHRVLFIGWYGVAASAVATSFLDRL